MIDAHGPRRERWRRLLHLLLLSFTSDLVEFATVDLPPHPDEAQVALDIDRLFTAILFHPPVLSLLTLDEGNLSYTAIWLPQEVAQLRKRLKTLVISVLRHHPCLNYYQGYHDVALIVLLICPEGSSDAFDILQLLTVNYLRDFMVKDISLTMCHLRLIMALIEIIDPELYMALGERPNYDFFPAISSIITLFSHDVTKVADVFSIWDFILERGSISAALYIYTAALVHYRHRFVNETDPDIIHSMALPTKLFANVDDWLEILEKAATFYDDFKFEELPNSLTTYDLWFKKSNSHSVLAGKVINVDDLDTTMAIQDEEVAEFNISESSDDLSLALLTLTLIPLVIYSKFDSVKHVPNLYKIGLTVGFVGVLIHLLLKLQYVQTKISDWALVLLNRVFHQSLWTPLVLMINLVGLGRGQW